MTKARCTREKAGFRLEELEAELVESRGQLAEAQEGSTERRRLFEILDALPAMTCLLTPEHKVVFANRMLRERFGEAQGRPCYEVFGGRSSPCEFCQSFVPLETGQAHQWQINAPSGRVMSAFDAPFTDLDGSRLILKMNVDITEQKRAQAELEQQRDRLEDLVRHRTLELEHAKARLEAELALRRDAEEAIKRSEEKFSSAFESSPAAITISRLSDGLLLDANKAAEIMFASSRETSIGQSTFRFWPSAEARAQQIKKVLDEGSIYNSEQTLLRASGEPFVVSMSITKMKVAQEELILTTCVDITEHRQAEEALRAGEERLRLAQQAARIGTFEWNLQTGVNTWTPELEAMYGLPRGEFARTQTAWEHLVHPEDREYATGQVERALKSGEPVEAEFRVVWPDKSVHWMNGRWQSFKDESGEPLRLTGINIDITERKQAEAQIARLASFPELNPSFIFETDLDGKLTYLNPSARRRFPTLETAALGHPLLREWSSVTAPIAAGAAQSAAREVETDDLVLFQHLYSPQPGIVRAYCLDVTERKRAELAWIEIERVALQREQLRSLAARLEEAREDERTRVARELHDDISQVLVAIMMDLARVEKELAFPSKAAKERLKRAVDLTSKTLDTVQKLYKGLRPFLLDDLGLAAAIESVGREFSSKTGIRSKVSVSAGDFRLDPAKATAIYRIGQECLANVERHAEARTVHISLSERKRSICLRIKDDGKGFVEAEVPGMLGILGMKERARGCGGELRIASSQGRGTVVNLRVPK